MVQRVTMSNHIYLLVSIAMLLVHGGDTQCADGEYNDGDDCESCSSIEPMNTLWSFAPGDQAQVVCQPFTCTASEQCGQGTYSLAGANKCTPCIAGTYSAATGAANVNTCVNCGTGTYSVTVGATSSATCLPCDPGEFSTVVGAASDMVCQSCGIGTYSVAGSGNCGTCEAGFECPTAATKNPCPAGTMSGGGSTACTPCQPGTFSGEQATDCTPCLSGQFSTSGQASCVICEAGQRCVPSQTCS
jgi:hypothetical protein